MTPNVHLLFFAVLVLPWMVEKRSRSRIARGVLLGGFELQDDAAVPDLNHGPYEQDCVPLAHLADAFLDPVQNAVRALGDAAVEPLEVAVVTHRRGDEADGRTARMSVRVWLVDEEAFGRV